MCLSKLGYFKVQKLKEMHEIFDCFPQYLSDISTTILDSPRVSVSQVEIDPQAVFICDANVHFIEIKASAF